jgi:hypothetical protein
MAIGCTLNLAGEFAMENPVLQFREAAAELGAPIASQALPGPRRSTITHRSIQKNRFVELEALCSLLPIFWPE